LEIDEGWDELDLPHAPPVEELAPTASGAPVAPVFGGGLHLTNMQGQVHRESSLTKGQATGRRKSRSTEKLASKAARKAKKAAARKAERKVAAEGALRKAEEARARAPKARKPERKASPAHSSKARPAGASGTNATNGAGSATAKPPAVLFGAALAAALLAVAVWWMWLRR
jgi:hypothetical protein